MMMTGANFLLPVQCNGRDTHAANVDIAGLKEWRQATQELTETPRVSECLIDIEGYAEKTQGQVGYGQI